MTNENQHRRSAEQAFEEALAKLQKLPAAEVESDAAEPELLADNLGEVWEEAGADLEAFFAQDDDDAAGESPA